jgi:hypothetical protein
LVWRHIQEGCEQQATGLIFTFIKVQVNVEDLAVCGRRALSAHASRMKSSERKEVRIHDKELEKKMFL